MRVHEEQLPPSYPQAAFPISNPNLRRAGHVPAALATAPISPPLAAASEDLSDGEASPDLGTQGRQDARIRAILRQMSLGHLLLGCVLLVGGVLLEAALHQPAFFGLAASGGMLAACGLITLLAINRQPTHQVVLGFYLLPYADFAIVGLWLLLFGINSSIALLYAYVLVSAALFLGSRHALALTIITSATLFTVSLGQFTALVKPAITLPTSEQITFNLLFTLLGLSLVAYAAALFSSNLDRFILQNNRQIDQLASMQARFAEQRQQLERELELLTHTYVRFTNGETHLRVPVAQGMLAQAGQQMNALFEQIEQFWRARKLTARMEERVAELHVALERFYAGDPYALQAISTPSNTSLDSLTVLLARLIRQIADLQQVTQRARGNYALVQSLASELTLIRQSMNGASGAIRELLSRSSQSALHLRAMIETTLSPAESHHPDRPFLREMELRARQQNGELELLYARLEHIMVQMETSEAALRQLAEQGELATRGQRPPRTTLPIGPMLEQTGSQPTGTPARSENGALTGMHSTSGPLGNSALKATDLSERPDSSQAGSSPLRRNGASPFPRRFTSPLVSSSRSDQEGAGAWTTS